MRSGDRPGDGDGDGDNEDRVGGVVRTYTDNEGIVHVQSASKRFNWADWDAKRKGTGSGEGGRVGKFDTVRIEHSGGEKVNASGKVAAVGAGTLHGRVVDGLGDRDKTLHVRDGSEVLHRIPKDGVKSVEVVRAAAKGTGLAGRDRTPTSGEIATMGIPGAGGPRR
jgi:hypothetical protein